MATELRNLQADAHHFLQRSGTGENKLKQRQTRASRQARTNTPPTSPRSSATSKAASKRKSPKAADQPKKKAKPNFSRQKTVEVTEAEAREFLKQSGVDRTLTEMTWQGAAEAAAIQTSAADAKKGKKVGGKKKGSKPSLDRKKTIQVTETEARAFLKQSGVERSLTDLTWRGNQDAIALASATAASMDTALETKADKKKATKKKPSLSRKKTVQFTETEARAFLKQSGVDRSLTELTWHGQSNQLHNP